MGGAPFHMAEYQAASLAVSRLGCLGLVRAGLDATGSMGRAWVFELGCGCASCCTPPKKIIVFLFGLLDISTASS